MPSRFGICIFLCPVCRIRQRPWRRKVRRIPHWFVLECLIYAIEKATEQARAVYGPLPAVFTGGVSSNRLLRERMEPCGGIFGTPACSTDNAMGIAVLTWLAENQLHGT